MLLLVDIFYFGVIKAWHFYYYYLWSYYVIFVFIFKLFFFVFFTEVRRLFIKKRLFTYIPFSCVKLLLLSSLRSYFNLSFSSKISYNYYYYSCIVLICYLIIFYNTLVLLLKSFFNLIMFASLALFYEYIIELFFFDVGCSFLELVGVSSIESISAGIFFELIFFEIGVAKLLFFLFFSISLI